MQLEESINIDEGEGIIKENLKNFHFQRKKWRHDSRNALCWSFYYVNDNNLVDVKCFQLMKCIFCYANLVLISNVKTQARKGLILYNNANGINALKKHVYAYHYMIAKMFDEEVKNMLKKPYERQHAKKRPHVNGTIIFDFFATKKIYKKDDVQQK